MALNPAILANANQTGANGGGISAGANPDAVNDPDFLARQAAANSAAGQGGANGNPVNATTSNQLTQPGITAATAALQAVSDPSRFAQADQARQTQNAVANYYGGIVSGQSPLVTTLQRQQSQDAAIQANQAQRLSGPGAGGPAQSSAALGALGGAQGSAISGAEGAAIQEQANALGNINTAAGNMRSGDVNQALGTGAQQLAGAAQVAGLYDTNADRSLKGAESNQTAYLTGRGQDIASTEAANARQQQQAQYQTQYDQQNNWWNKYAMPGLHAGATVGSAALAKG